MCIDGQISIFEYMHELNKVHSVDIKGLCDDAYCPVCGYEFKDWLGEVDIDCPECKTRLDWTIWHKINDEV